MADCSPEVRVEHCVDDGVEGGAGQGQPLDDRHHSLTGRGARGEEGLGITAVTASCLKYLCQALTRQM